MEQEKNKRVREINNDYDDIAKIHKKSKRIGKSLTKDKNEVFDFPWLKDGVICKSEEYFNDFEDNNTCFKVSYDVDFFDTSMVHHIPEAKLIEDLWLPFEINGLELEAEDFDCVWSSLINN